MATYSHWWKNLALDHIRLDAMDDTYIRDGRQGLILLGFRAVRLLPLYIESTRARSDTVCQLERLVYIGIM